MMGTHLPICRSHSALLQLKKKKLSTFTWKTNRLSPQLETLLSSRYCKIWRNGHILSACLCIVRIFLLHFLSFSTHTLPSPVSMRTEHTHPGRLCLLWLRCVCLMHVRAHCMSYRVPYVRPILAISSQRSRQTAIRLPALCHETSWSCWRAPHCGVHHIAPPRQK